MKRVVVDIETSPNLADVWGLFNQNISLNQLRASTRVICFAAKEIGKPKVEFRSDFHDGHDKMIARAWEIIDQADVLVTYNGIDFDVKHLNREFLLAGASAPSPTLQVDLLRTMRSRFKFASNKLDHVSQQLAIGKKIAHEGHELWVKCLAGDAAAWNRMRTYCKYDVVLTEKLHDRLGSWIVSAPNLLLEGGECPQCGGTNMQKRGAYRTRLASYQRYRCSDCGGWSRGKRAIESADLRAVQ